MYDIDIDIDIDIETIDIDSLREDLQQELFGAGMIMGTVVTGIPVPLSEWSDIDNLDDEEVIDKALSMGYDLDNYKKDEYAK